MNAAIEKMLTRHAIRRLRPEQISETELRQVLEAGLYAPSAGNNQESRLVVCQNAKLNEKLGRINRFTQFKGQNPAAVAHAISAEQPRIQDDFSILSGYYGAPTGDSTIHPGQQIPLRGRGHDGRKHAAGRPFSGAGRVLRGPGASCACD